MRSYLVKFFLCLLVLLSWDSTHQVVAASDSSEHLVTDEKDTKISKPAREKYKSTANAMFPNCSYIERVKIATKEGFQEAIYLYITTSPAQTVTDFTIWLGAIASGTSGCEKVEYVKMQQHRFALIAKDSLARDMANGGGEFITTMAYLQGCLTSTYSHYIKMAQKHFADIFPLPETDPITMVTNLEYQIAQDFFLSHSCKWVS